MREYAYAKINLYLDVTGKRNDGFHDIRTLMHSVTLYDVIDISAEKSDGISINIHSNSSELASDESNLVYRAAKLYLTSNKICSRINIDLTKNIPISAGLAGGSTDAAATLRALNRMYSAMSREELLSLAASIGSDVPYCLVGGTALCLGRGEEISRIDTDMCLHLVIAVGNDKVSTPAAYSRLDALYSNFDGTVLSDDNGAYERLISSLGSDGTPIDGLYNIFETQIEEVAESVVKIKAELKSMGAYTSLMSGSGPSVFGVFHDAASARSAQNALSQKGYSAYYATSVCNKI